jgi:HPt (histidine-containing phosphotransfer) domain-containing protein
MVPPGKEGAMPDEASFEDRLARAAARLEDLLKRQRGVEQKLRWVDDRQNELRRRCEEVDEAIAHIQRVLSNGRHA